MQEKTPFSSYFDFFPNVCPPPAYFDFALRHAPEDIHNINRTGLYIAVLVRDRLA